MASSSTVTVFEDLLTRIVRLLCAQRRQLVSGAQLSLDTVITGLRAADIPGHTHTTKRRSVCRLLPGLFDSTANLDRELSNDLRAAESSLHWTQRYETGPVSDTSFDNYGHAALVSPDGPAVHTHMKLGIIILGPGELDPDHAHAAGEFYTILTGDPEWRIGDGCWHSRQPGDLIHHPPEVSHATRTRDSALLALYAWYGATHAPSRFV